MANDCYNWANFTGKKENLQRMVQGLEAAQESNKENHGLLWYKAYYIALGTEAPEESVMIKDVYDEFGSKWYDIHDIEFDENSVAISGTSAWSPVSQFFLKLSEAYELQFESEFEEPGSDFGGYFAGKNGEVTDDRTYTYEQYAFLQRDFEAIDLDSHEFETREEAIEHYQPIREICNDKDWAVVLGIIEQTFKDRE
jgi:hypothetical protein